MNNFCVCRNHRGVKFLNTDNFIADVLKVTARNRFIIRVKNQEVLFYIISTPKNITLIISVNPVADKIKYFV